MSTLNVTNTTTDTLTGQSVGGSIAVTGENTSTNTTDLQGGLCKVWTVYDQNSSLTVTDSNGSSSVTDVGNAEGTVNFTVNFNTSLGYATTGVNGFTNAGGTDLNCLLTLNNANSSASAARFFGPGFAAAANSEQQIVDFDYNSRVFWGDLA